MHLPTPLRSLARACCLLTGFFLANLASAQSAATGTITGVISDASGKYLEGAEVSVAGTGLRATTEREGVFRLEGVPAGPQSLAISYPA